MIGVLARRITAPSAKMTIMQNRRIAYDGKMDVRQKVKIKELISSLESKERQLLYKNLRKVLLEEERLKKNYERSKSRNPFSKWFAKKTVDFKKYIEKPTKSQLYSLFAYHSLPYLAFGCLDNCIMILAGEYIQTSIGSAIGLSMMGSAALGNALANSSSIAVAYHVEKFFTKRIQGPSTITIGQFELRGTRLVIQYARVIGIVSGCLLGMTPLLFR